MKKTLLCILSALLQNSSMANALKNFEKISQIVHLKQLIRRWRSRALLRSDSSVPTRRIPAGFLAVYVGPERRRFVIPTRYLNLPIFVSLLKKAEEEYGYEGRGGLVLPCEVEVFERVLRVLEKEEQRFGNVDLEEVLKMFGELGFESSNCCRDRGTCCHAFTPLLQKARV